MNKDLSGVAAMIKEGGSTVNILFLAGGSERKHEKTNVEYPADCSSDNAHATKALAEAEGQKEDLAGSATSTANKTNQSIEVAVIGKEIADQSSATVMAGLVSLESVARRGPLCSVGGCTRESQGLRCKGMCQYHYYEKYLAAKSICTDEIPVKSAREKNQHDEMVVERAIAANARGRDSTILQTLTAVVKSAGPMAIDVCSNFIRTYLMQKTCSDWSSSSSKTTQCTCMQILLPDQIRSSATFVATAWCKMTQEEKVDQLALWIQQKGDGTLPYCLPTAEPSSGRPMSTKICRNALCAVLFVPTTLWKKAEDRACALVGAEKSSSNVDKPEKTMAEKAAAATGARGVNTGTAASSSKECSSNVDRPEKTMAKKAAATGDRGTGTEASIVEVSSPSSFDAQEGQAYAYNSNMKRAKKTVAPTKAAVTMAQSETDANDANKKAAGDQEPPSKGVKNVGEEVSLATHRNIVAASAKRSFSGATASVRSGRGTATGKSPPKCTAGIYGALNKMVETSGPHSVEACSRCIRSYVMQQSCYDWVSSTCTGCFCAKTLNPSQIWGAATYVTTTWYKKSEEEKMAQLVLWIKQKKSGNLPFLLPSVRRVGSTGEPKRLCRGALMKLLFVPASMWRKAEERASPSATINSETNSSVRALDKPPGEHVRAAVNCFGKKFLCSVTGCPNFSQSTCPGMCLSHFNETIAKRGMSIDQRSGCDKAGKVNVVRPRVQIQQAQIGSKKTRESGADNFSTTKLNGTITSLESIDISKRKDCTKKPTSGQVAGNAVRRINQERAIKSAPLNSFVVALTKPMGITLLQQSGRIEVAAIKTGSPAERSGKVGIGNVLLAVNGRDVTNMDVDDVVKMIKDGGSISDCLLFSSENSAQSGDACFNAKYSKSQGHFQRTRKAEDLSSFSSILPIGTREKRGSRFHCSVEGCLELSQRNCRGMCVSHFKESVAKDSVTAIDSPEKRDSTAAPVSVSFVTPSPAKKCATNRCSMEGCSKYKQSKCNEMCRAHYLESQKEADNSIEISNSGRRRIEPRKPTKSHCGTCHACMVDECGECKHCLDMPRFGGKWKLRQKCLNRPLALFADHRIRQPLSLFATRRMINRSGSRVERGSDRIPPPLLNTPLPLLVSAKRL